MPSRWHEGHIKHIILAFRLSAKDSMKLMYPENTFHIVAREVLVIRERMTLKNLSCSPCNNVKNLLTD